MKRKKDLLLALLREGRKIGYWEIMHKIGTTSPRDLIFKLRKAGYIINSKAEPNTGGKGTHNIYWL